jgi:RimJ/RimL family protein N-acetyltransferase
MITGKLVNLRALERTDLDSLREWLNDLTLLRLSGYPAWPLAPIDYAKWYERLAETRDLQILAIETRDKDLIGYAMLRHIDPRNRTAEVNVVIGERGYWGRGYGPDALQTLLGFAFNDLNLATLYAYIPEFNTRARRAFEKVGFRVDGTLRRRYFSDGRYWDLIAVSLLAEEYQQRQTREE